MFAKDSRYYKLTNTAKPDANGRVVESKSLRFLPEVRGRFQHIVEDSDRLDNLAYKYYKEPRRWWRLCDANPEFSSPRELLGKAPLRVTRFPVQWEGARSPWHELTGRLAQLVGVEKVLLGTDEKPYPDEDVFDVALMFSLPSTLEPELAASILSQELTAPLDAALQGQGLTLTGKLHLQQISVTHWRIGESISESIYTLRLESGVLNVFESSTRYEWSVTVYYNSMNIARDEIAAEIELASAPAFTASAPVDLGRVGKPIVVPPGGAGN
jgi:hypothetical protein